MNIKRDSNTNQTLVENQINSNFKRILDNGGINVKSNRNNSLNNVRAMKT